jgi:hypothetical protein
MGAVAEVGERGCEAVSAAGKSPSSGLVAQRALVIYKVAHASVQRKPR